VQRRARKFNIHAISQPRQTPPRYSDDCRKGPLAGVVQHLAAARTP